MLAPGPTRTTSPPRLLFPSALASFRNKSPKARERTISSDLEMRLTRSVLRLMHPCPFPPITPTLSRMGNRRWRRFVNDQFLNSSIAMPTSSEALEQDLSDELPFYRRGVRFSQLSPADFGEEETDGQAGPTAEHFPTVLQEAPASPAPPDHMSETSTRSERMLQRLSKQERNLLRSHVGSALLSQTELRLRRYLAEVVTLVVEGHMPEASAQEAVSFSTPEGCTTPDEGEEGWEYVQHADANPTLSLDVQSFLPAKPCSAITMESCEGPLLRPRRKGTRGQAPTFVLERPCAPPVITLTSYASSVSRALLHHCAKFYTLRSWSAEPMDKVRSGLPLHPTPPPPGHPPPPPTLHHATPHHAIPRHSTRQDKEGERYLERDIWIGRAV